MPVARDFMKMKNKGERKKTKGAKVKLFNKKKNVNIDEVIAKLQAAYDKINPKEIHKFSDFPFSFKTLKGLKENGFVIPTEIQKESIGCALQGNDILGAAKTGSGKTLAFLIPVLEKLFCKKWTRLDGTGALIITPTRELAYQIFETLRKVGFYHDFSAGLIIGGKDLKFEKKRMDQCNIVICTPGRLLHHMDENPLFDCVNLQILVLDEADRCLDMGFEETMNSIIENLPPHRQTLLFSATQTKSVRDLARLSLVSPKYISVHENSSYSTPEGLTQSYMICELEDKLAVLWSFIRNHYKHKILVFLSSCKQVKYVFEIFCQLRPGIALLALYGSLHQQRRMDIYRSFCNKEHAVLFATDIAARGLDFPAVNWVIQMDCPEDATTYIHRVGRTARYHKGGEALLVLLPSEADAMLAKLKEKKIPINEIKVNPKKLQNPRIKIEAMLAKKPDLKESAQRAFVAYVKSVFLMKDKNVFDVHKLNTDSFARSLGLVVSPRIRFLQRIQRSQIKKENVDVQSSESGGNSLSTNVHKEQEIKEENVKSESESSSEEEETDNKKEYRNNVKVKKESRPMIETLTKIKSENEIKSEPESENDSDDDAEEDDGDDDDDNGDNYNKEENKSNGENDGKGKISKSSVTVGLDSGSKSQLKRFQTFNFGIDDSDSDEEILKMKRIDHALDEDSDNNEVILDEPGKRRKKPVTKAAIAKRILKKHIVPNKKIVFTEEGEAIQDKFKQRVTELGRKYEEDVEGGGISIEEAKKVLKEEDKVDRDLFKQRIKAKHREERLKLKKLRKGEDSDKDDEEKEQDEDGDYEEYSGSNSESVSEKNISDSSEYEDSSGGEVDDDDDYNDGEEHNSNEDTGSSEEDNSISRNLSRKGIKRKQNSAKVESKRFKGIASNNTLSQDEELALKLLSSKS